MNARHFAILRVLSRIKRCDQYAYKTRIIWLITVIYLVYIQTCKHVSHYNPLTIRNFNLSILMNKKLRRSFPDLLCFHRYV